LKRIKEAAIKIRNDWDTIL